MNKVFLGIYASSVRIPYYYSYKESPEIYFGIITYL
jgi:hypothetical protein